jgi:hypothetical protein
MALNLGNVASAVGGSALGMLTGGGGDKSGKKAAAAARKAQRAAAAARGEVNQWKAIAAGAAVLALVAFASK